MNGRLPLKFRLALLGRFELSGPNGPVGLPSKKLAGLLAYLACAALQPQRREKLATLLWGSHIEAQARQSLCQALFRLRRILGQDALVGYGEEVALAPGAMACDVVRLETLIREDSPASLAEAVDLYKGHLLTDLNIAEEAWEDWVAGERQRVQGLALEAMIRLAEQELQSGRPEAALYAANRAIANNNLREDAHRLVILAMTARGNRGLALKHYDELVGFLRRELDVGPDAATLALAVELRRSQPQTNSGEPPPNNLPTTRPRRIHPQNMPNVDWHPPCQLPKWQG